MSDRPMQVPSGAGVSPYAELLLCLPPDWPLDQSSLANERHYWPIRWLKMLARFPHEYDSWLGPAHTMPNGDPPQPLAPDTDLCAVLIFSPLLFGDEIHQLVIDGQTSIAFSSVVPLYREELELKLARGFEALLDRMAEANLTELLDPQRPNLCAPRGRFGRRR